MAYSQQQQQQYHHTQYDTENNYKTPPPMRSVQRKKDSIPTAVNNIVLKQQQPKYTSHNNQNNQTNQNKQNNPNINGYYQSQPFQPPISRRQYHSTGPVPPPITSSHKQHIKQNKRPPNNKSAPKPYNSSSSEDGVEEEFDQHGQVVINVSYLNYSNNTQYQSNPPPHTYNDHNNNYNNGYQNGYNNEPHPNQNPQRGYVPPYASYNNNNHNQHSSHNSYNNYNPPPRRIHTHKPPPPPLPKHKMQNYGAKASPNNGYPINPNHHNIYNKPPPNHKSPPNHMQQQPSYPHKLSTASTETFATSFETFENVLDDNEDGIDAIDTFAPIHYDQRFSIHKSNALRKQHQKSHPQQHNESQSNSSHDSNKPPPAPINTINKQLHKQRYNKPNLYKRKSGPIPNVGVKNAAITKANTESFVDSLDYKLDKPTTPSHSFSIRNDGSETRDSDLGDFDLLQRDKDYRPSIVQDLQHTDDALQVTIDRYGFPMDDEIDEKEHRKQVKKENGRLLKWQDMVFSKKLGGTAAESNNEVDEQIAHWNQVKNHRKLKSRIRKGIPQQLRGTIWQNLSGARERRKIECARYGSKNLYNDLRGRKKSKYHDQIWKDINRTYRKNLIFGASQLANAQSNLQNTERNKGGAVASHGGKNKKGTQKFFKNILQDPQVLLTPQDLERNATPAQAALYNVLKAFSLYRRDIGYCQGMQAVTALLLMYMTEEEAFWVLASLADDTKYQMDNLWRPSMPAIQLRFYQMERLVKITLPKLSVHFEKCGISSASMYQASQWFITIFLATDMKFCTITRVWDIYLNEGLKTVFRMGVGFLRYFEKQLLKCEFEEMLGMFRTGANKLDPEEYVKVCFAQRITHAQLAAFEKDFNRQQQKKKH